MYGKHLKVKKPVFFIPLSKIFFYDIALSTGVGNRFTLYSLSKERAHIIQIMLYFGTTTWPCETISFIKSYVNVGVSKVAFHFF